jgi:hypothetical protein|tara:strand:+ start:2296 stop:2520 length:225 start_codon:yes stop_codon:yes gene_type:complete
MSVVIYSCEFFLNGRSKTYNGSSLSDCCRKFNKDYAEALDEIKQIDVTDFKDQGRVTTIPRTDAVNLLKENQIN